MRIIVSSEQRTGSKTLFFLCVLRAILLISQDFQSICWDERLKPYPPYPRGVFWSLSECFCHSMLATNIVKICRWLFPLCIRVIWLESIVLSTKQIPDCWTLCGQDWGLVACFACEWWQFIRRMQDIIGQAASSRRGWQSQYWGHTAGHSRAPASSGAPCQTEWPRLCVMCHVTTIIVNTHYTKRKDEWYPGRTLHSFRALPLKAWNVNEAKSLSPSKVLKELFILTTVVFAFYEGLSNSESVLWNLMKYD